MRQTKDLKKAIANTRTALRLYGKVTNDEQKLRLLRCAADFSKQAVREFVAAKHLEASP